MGAGWPGLRPGLKISIRYFAIPSPCDFLPDEFGFRGFESRRNRDHGHPIAIGKLLADRRSVQCCLNLFRRRPAWSAVAASLAGDPRGWRCRGGYSVPRTGSNFRRQLDPRFLPCHPPVRDSARLSGRRFRGCARRVPGYRVIDGFAALAVADVMAGSH
jgi:hypothetical protein